MAQLIAFSAVAVEVRFRSLSDTISTHSFTNFTIHLVEVQSGREPDGQWWAESKVHANGLEDGRPTVILEVGWDQPWTSNVKVSLRDDADYWITQEGAELVILIGLQKDKIIVPNPNGPYPPHRPQVQFNMEYELWQKQVAANGAITAVQIPFPGNHNDVRLRLFFPALILDQI